MGSALPLYKAARAEKINPILGCELYVVPDDQLGMKGKEFRSSSKHLTVLALSKEGYQNLVAWTTFSNQEENFYYRPRISLEAMYELAPHPLHHNVILTGCLGSELCSGVAAANGNGISAGESYVRAVRSVFPNVFIELQNHYRPKFMDRGFVAYESMLDFERSARDSLISIARQTRTPVILTNDSHFQRSSQRKSHLAMRASSWRTRDDSTSKATQTANYMADYVYWCVTPQTRVLTKNFKWKEAGEINVGDELWGFDENLNGSPGDHARIRNRRIRTAIVDNSDRKEMPCSIVALSNGDRLTVSDSHPWLVYKYPTRAQLVWKKTSELNPGDTVPRFFEPWGVINTRRAGWLAGIYDGEGSLTATRQLQVAQNDGLVLTSILKNIEFFGFTAKEIGRVDKCRQFYIEGGIHEVIKFIGEIRPVRLIEKLERFIEGTSMVMLDKVEVVSIGQIGFQEVVRLSTSTRTFFAEGYAAHNTNYMQSMERVAEGIDKNIRKEALNSSLDVAAEASIRLDPLDNFNFSIPFSGYSDPISEMRHRSKRRLRILTEQHGAEAKTRFNYELESMGDFAHYLLLMSDFIRSATKQGILTNSRGSAANSLVCYTLGIHNVDPLHYNLIFSRFFNPARKKLPDIDIDIEDDRYEDFMRIVRERITELEGDGQLVQICNYGTFANRSAFKLIADALGMDKEKQEEISKLLPQMIDSGMVDEDADVYAALKEQYPDIYELASGVFDGIRNVSQHACGWLFGTAARPIKDWVPLVRISSSGVSVTAYNLKSLDDLGLVKGDFLRLKSLSVIKRTLKMTGKDVLDLEKIPLDDKATFERLRNGKTEGIFTLQGKENRRGCIEVEVGSVHDVIKTVAIYRPALTREGKHTVYNNRRKGHEDVPYPHEIAEAVVGDTFGVPVFQEQAMELGYSVGMSDAEVDEIYQAIKLAKGVGRGAKEAFAEIRPKFMKRASRMGLTREEREGVWSLLVSFQGYGFNKGHATSYGILATRSAYLATHSTQEFFTSLLDVYPEKHKYIAAARAEGFKFLPPDVNFSAEGFSLDKISGGIRVGLARVKGLGPVAVRTIISNQPFRSFEDFRERLPKASVKVNQVEALSAVGAFASVGLKPTSDDEVEFTTLGFTLKKPRALRNLTPKHVGARTSGSGWVHDGREKGVELTQARHSVSKLFYVPAGTTLVLKASPWAGVKTHLLTVIDENGLPFEIMVPEDKEQNVALIKFLHRRCQGKALSLDGAVRQPFLTDGPLGFRLQSVSGAHFAGDPQVWEITKAEKAAIIELHRRMRNA
jgi:DNA polymerase III alpha subunit